MKSIYSASDHDFKTNSSCTLIAASYILIKVFNLNFALYKSGSQFGWHPHPVVIFKTFDTRMTSPSGSQFDFVMRTGWHPHPVVKFFKYDNRMSVPSGSHNKIKLRTGWCVSGSHAWNRITSPFAVDNAPNFKLTTLIINWTY